MYLYLSYGLNFKIFFIFVFTLFEVFHTTTCVALDKPFLLELFSCEFEPCQRFLLFPCERNVNLIAKN